MSLNLLCWIFSDIKQFFMTALILISVIALLYVFIKYEQTRNWVGCLIVFVMLCSSLISGFKIYQYFNASGGTVGDFVSSIFGSSNAEKVGEYSFKFKNIAFKNTQNENEYIASYQDTYSNESGVFDLDMSKNWNIFVNNDVTTNNVKGSNYVFADYIYTFYDQELNKIFTDTLKIKFVFYNNYYEINLITNNGITATDFWQSYFKKENFIVSLKINNYIPENEFVTDSYPVKFTTELHTVADISSTNFSNFNKENTGIYLTVLYKENDTYLDVITFEISGFLKKDIKNNIIYYTTYIVIDNMNNINDYYYKIDNGSSDLSVGTIGQVVNLKSENKISGLYSSNFILN